MTKSELIEIITAKQKHLPAKDVELALKQILEIMSDALSAGERIEIRGFGSFEIREYRAGILATSYEMDRGEYSVEAPAQAGDAPRLGPPVRATPKSLNNAHLPIRYGIPEAPAPARPAHFF